MKLVGKSYLLIISASCSLGDGMLLFDQAIESNTKIKDLPSKLCMHALHASCMHCIPASCLQLACNACMHHACNLAQLHACSCIDEEGACMKNHMQACMHICMHVHA